MKVQEKNRLILFGALLMMTGAAVAIVSTVVFGGALAASLEESIAEMLADPAYAAELAAAGLAADDALATMMGIIYALLGLGVAVNAVKIAVGALTGDFYHDGDCLYMDVLDGNESYRGKIPLTELSALLEEYLEYLQTGTAVPLIAGSGHGGSDVSSDLQTMFSVGLDDGDGIKLKLAANDNYFTTIEESVTGGSDAIEFSFRSKILELYLSIDGDGRFEQLSARIDLAYEASYEGQSLEMRAKGEFILRTGNAVVRLPDELSDEEEYPFFTDNGFLPSPM